VRELWLRGCCQKNADSVVQGFVIASALSTMRGVAIPRERVPPVERRRTCSPGSSCALVARRSIIVVRVARRSIESCTRVNVWENKNSFGLRRFSSSQIDVDPKNQLPSAESHVKYFKQVVYGRNPYFGRRKEWDRGKESRPFSQQLGEQGPTLSTIFCKQGVPKRWKNPSGCNV